MAGYNMHMPPDTDKNETNKALAAYLDTVQGQSYDATTICSSGEFVARHLILPAVEGTIQAYIKACTPLEEPLITSNWTLCKDDTRFNCGSLYRYTTTCKDAREHNCGSGLHPGTIRTTLAPSGSGGGGGFMSEGFMEDPAAVALLVGLVVLGILIGIFSTIAACLIWPGLHRWANSKIRPHKSSQRHMASRNQPVVSAYYADIDDKQLKQKPPSFRKHPVTSTVSSSSYSSSSSRDYNDPTLSDRQLFMTVHSSGFRSGSRQPYYTETPEPEYEKITSRGSRKQSHPYAHCTNVPSPLPTNSSDDYNSYFVLERKLDQR